MINSSEINSRQLRIFLAVFEEKGLGKAAKKLFLTQPAISQAIASLESQLGVLLFDRSRKGATPTEAAELLRDAVIKSEEFLSDALIAISELNELKRGNLSIAASDTLSLYLLPKPLAQFRKTYPGIEVNIRNRPSDEIVEMVKLRDADAGLISLYGSEDGLEISRINDSSMKLILPKKSGFKFKGDISLKDLLKLDLILLERKNRIRRMLEDSLKSGNDELKVVMEVSSFEVAKRFVREGLGASILPQIALDKHDYANLRVLPMPTKIPAVSYGLITRKGVKSRAIEQFKMLFTIDS